ncbi:MAG: MarR family transcriptional regulator [Dehalococcoidia bacterium]
MTRPRQSELNASAPEVDQFNPQSVNGALADGEVFGSAAWMRLARPYLRMAKAAERRLLPLDLGLTSALILSRLAAASEAQRMSDLARFVEVEPQSITSLVDRLERVGFVLREKHPSDRRATVLAVTESGRKAAEQVEEALGRTLQSSQTSN